ncbi:lipopolysaccharide biosynthesis protein [Pelagibacterium sediminicola]|uniref:lipopolysaccharide biosynthesis protein n=1 Tax=Pelagibacterium sediminicola TaxID=2248761 RepID=UPI000E31A9CA|nr:hypothetical protein [Pelagibacterium sediminicola]
MIQLSRLLNIGLRFGTLGTRFFFIFFLARFLDAESVGYYGIFTATVSYGMLFFGLEFYTHVTRNFGKASVDERGQILKGQIALSSLLYIGSAPLVCLFLLNTGWPEHLVFWFMPIMILEHFNQEIFRLLVVMQRQIAASLLLFVRQGTWALAIIAIFFLNEGGRSLDIVMLNWFVATFAAALLGAWEVTKLDIEGWRKRVDWIWVRHGVSVALPFLIATLSQRGVITLDRYWLESLGGIGVVGSYVLFFGIISGLSVFLEAGIFSFVYPELINHHHRNEHTLARAKVRRMFYQTAVVCAGFAIISMALLPVILDWVGDPVHLEHVGMYPWLLLAMSALAMSQVAHWALYASGQDRQILFSHVASLTTFAVVMWFTSGQLGTYAVLAGINAAFVLLLIWKWAVYAIALKRLPR